MLGFVVRGSEIPIERNISSRSDASHARSAASRLAASDATSTFGTGETMGAAGSARRSVGAVGASGEIFFDTGGEDGVFVLRRNQSNSPILRILLKEQRAEERFQSYLRIPAKPNAYSEGKPNGIPG
jgi:hypothetical protein